MSALISLIKNSLQISNGISLLYAHFSGPGPSDIHNVSCIHRSSRICCSCPLMSHFISSAFQYLFCYCWIVTVIIIFVQCHIKWFYCPRNVFFFWPPGLGNFNCITLLYCIKIFTFLIVSDKWNIVVFVLFIFATITRIIIFYNFTNIFIVRF